MYSGDGDSYYSETEIFAQVYDDDGNPVGAEIQVSTDRGTEADTPTVTALVGGGFAVAWEDYQSGMLHKVRSASFDSDGQQIGQELLVSGRGLGSNGMAPDIVALSNGGYAVAFSNYGETAIALVDSIGTMSDELFVVPHRGFAPEIAQLNDGSLLVSWQTIEDGIAAQRYTILDDPMNLSGTSGADTLTGGSGSDSIFGLGGNDELRGADGSDTIAGGGGSDIIFGGATTSDLRDVIYGGAGNDTIDGGYGNDELRGDAGQRRHCRRLRRRYDHRRHRRRHADGQRTRGRNLRR